MADATLLTTFYSFLLAILIFLATKFLDHNEKIRELLATNFDQWKDDKETYENLRDGVLGQVWIMVPILTAIFLALYLLIMAVFGGWKNIDWKNYVLIIATTVGLLLIFLQPIINNFVTVKAGYEGNPEKYLNMGKKK